MKLSKTMRRISLATAGAVLALTGSVSASHAFTFNEGATDAGSIFASARDVNAGGTDPTVYGLTNTIGGRLFGTSDTDIFRFLLGGPGGTADIGVVSSNSANPIFRLYNSSFGLINPAFVISATSNAYNLAAGTYYLEILRGVGVNPNATVNYSVSANFDPVPEPFTMMGGAAALGVGSLMQRKRKQNQLATQKAS